MKFLNKFYLFTGTNRTTNTVAESLHNPDLFFNCDPQKWPLCLFDFTYKNILHQFFVYRVNKNTVQILDDYFYGSSMNYDCDTEDSTETTVFDKLLIERNQHLCQHTNFTEKFIKMYVSGSD